MTKGNCGAGLARFGFALLLLLLFLAIGDSTQAASVTLIPSGSLWKYNDTGVNLGTAWREPAYNDSGWATGRAQLGYGDGDEVTVVNYGPNSSSKYVTTYFRHVFNLADASWVTALTLQVLRDDGAAVYLNGTLVATFNLPATFSSTTFASSASEYSWDPPTAIPASLLVAGDNVLAVEVHQGNATSSDLSFDLVLSSEQSLPGTGPQAPQGLAPADGAEGVNVPLTLQVTVADPDNDPLDVVFFGRKNQTMAPFSVVVLPDTQKYVATSAYASIFTQQTQWIVDQRATLNILAVSHEGDVADSASDTAQYDRANASLTLLDQAGIPYGLLPGNHDQPTTLFNQYFGPSRYAGKPWYGGNFPAGQNDNNYILFSGGGMDFILVQLGFWPSSAAIAWADGVLKAHPNRKAIITTHGYLGLDAQRNVHVMGSTEYIWTGLVVPNPNVWFVLCGHVHGEVRRTDYANGHPVYQMLADYQAEVNGGDGWLRILEFLPDQDAVQVRTYSPSLNRYQTDANSEFVLDFPMNGFKTLGTYAGQPSGSTVSHLWAEAEVGAEYQWFVTVTDPTGRTAQSPVWAFGTALSDVTRPVISQVSVSSLSDRSALVTWTTDEPADSRVDYCADGPGCQAEVDPSRVTQHSLWLEGLTAGTQYRYTLTSTDAAGNQTVSPQDFFTTLPENQRPVAVGQSLATSEDVPLAITLAGSDPESLPITFRLTSFPTHGSLTGTPPALTYAPAPNWSGEEAFAYVVNDGVQDSLPAMVTITVNSVNDAPAAPVVTATPGDGQVTLSWPASSDVEGDLVAYQVWRSDPANPTYRVVTAMSDPSFTDSPLQNGVTYTYVVRASDYSRFSDSAPVSATPRAPDYNAYVTANPVVTEGTLTGNYTATRQLADAAAQSLTELKTGLTASLDAVYTLETIASPSDISILTLRCSATYTDYADPLMVYVWQDNRWTDISADLLADGVFSPASPQSCVDGAGKLLVRFTDGATVRRETLGVLTIDLLMAEITLGGAPENRAPVAEDDAASTTPGTPVAINVLANDHDPDGDPVTVQVVTPPANGAVQVRADGAMIYQPGSGFAGTDVFVYSLDDGRGGTDTATVTVTVQPLATLFVYVGNIELTAAPSGKSWKATAKVTLRNQSQEPAIGASVTGDWYLNANLIQAGAASTTDASGTASLTSPSVKAASGTFRFVVRGVSLAGYDYQPGNNQESEDTVVFP